MSKTRHRGQSTAEYAIVIGLVIAAVVAMQVYVKRGIQGKFRDASDAKIKYTGNSDYGVNTNSLQYEPQYLTTTGMYSTSNVVEKTTTSAGGGVERAIVGNELTNRSGVQDILAP